MDTLTAKQFGALMACAEYGVPAELIPQIEGAAVKMASAEAGAVGRVLVKAAADVMEACGYKSAAAYHLRLVGEHPDWNTHCQEVFNHVSNTLMLLEPLEKKAFADTVSGAGALARGVGYGSLAAGAGMGTLYWLLSRHATEDEASIEAKQRQVDYYNQLSKELNDSMKRKYRYQQR